MLEDHDALVEALGAGGAHVVGVQDLQHGAACVSHQHGRDGIAEDECGHDHRRQIGPEILERADVARCRKPAQRHREEQDQHDAQPEIRRRQPPKRERVRGVVERGVPVDGGDDACSEPYGQRDDDGEESQLERDRQLLENEVEHRLLDAHRFAEVTLEHATGPVQVAHRQRVVEVELFVQVRDHARVPVFAGEDERRVARQQLLQAEDQDRDEEKRWDNRGEAMDEIGAHGPSVSVSALGMVDVLETRQPTCSRHPRESGDPVAFAPKTLNSRFRWSTCQSVALRGSCGPRDPHFRGQPLNAHQPIGNRSQAPELDRVRPQPVAVKEIHDRSVLEHDGRDLLVDFLALGRIGNDARPLSRSSTSGLQ